MTPEVFCTYVMHNQGLCTVHNAPSMFPYPVGEVFHYAHKSRLVAGQIVDGLCQCGQAVLGQTQGAQGVVDL